jgi:hypothetical protein
LFPNTTDVAVAYKTKRITVADVNNDGRSDLLTANSSITNAGTVNVRLNNGQGGFSQSSDVAIGGVPADVVTGDLNQDGKLDIVTANTGANTVSVRLGNGLGGFSGTTEVAVGQAPLQVALKDFNQDGTLDIVTVSASTNAVSLRLGDGSGNFSVPILPLRAEIAVAAGPLALAAADVNNDGQADIVTASASAAVTGLGTLSVQFGDGLGGFTGTGASTLTINPASMLLRDVNSDGKMDLLLPHANYAIANGRGGVSVRLGDGLGNFTSTTEVSVDTEPANITTGDVNGDGFLDLLTANRSNSARAKTISVRLGTGTGTFGGDVDYLIGTTPTNFALDLAVADMNSDGYLDLLAVSYNVVAGTTMNASIRLGNGQGRFGGYRELEIGQPTATGGTLVGVVPADVNKDNKVDFLAIDATNALIGVRVSDGTGGFNSMPAVALPPGSYPRTLAVGDVNNDGFVDFVTANAGAQTGSGTISVRLGDGQGHFTGMTNIALNSNPFQIYLSDVNNDGRLDILTTLYSTYAIRVLLGNGQGGFSGGSSLTQGIGNQVYLAIADLNEDGWPDIIASDADRGSIYRRFGDGAGNFTGTSSITPPNTPGAIASGDVNNDGHADIVTLDFRTGGRTGLARIYLGDGSGGLTFYKDIDTQTTTALSLATADLNGDGLLDLVVGSLERGTINVFLGSGGGDFAYSSTTLAGNYILNIATCDIDGDGDIDLLANCFSDNMVSIRLNGNRNTSPLAVLPSQTSGTFAPMVAWPNPAQGSVQLLNAPATTASLTDALGRQVREYKAISSQVDLAGLLPGLYLLRCGNQVVRLIID